MGASVGLVLLTACGSTSPDADEPKETAGTAPQSDFTVDCPTFEAPAGEATDDRLPDVTLECLGSEGEPVAIAGVPPRPTVINLWASWCGPCLEEMPILDEFAALGDGEVDVLGVVTQNARSQATAYAAEMDVTFPSVVDFEGQVLTAEGFVALPATILIDDEGTIAYRHIGPYKSIEDLAADVEKYLGVSL
ncbi:MAG: TlpA family protein disulfide reductase [Cumulibacter sp.]